MIKILVIKSCNYLFISDTLQAYSYWLYNVPWGLYKAIIYIKEHYGNPPVILSENGNT
jgi:beta-glucosidase/6-phospho-beta-glucosidase/beta-galactosidase